MKRVLLVGPGFVGRQTLEFFDSQKHEVHVLSRSRFKYDRRDTEIYHHVLDLFDYESVGKLLKAHQFTHILALAWNVEPGVYWHAMENYQWVNAYLNLLKCFAQYGGERFVAAGSCAEYDWRFGVLRENETQTSYSSPYATCKAATYHLLNSMSRQLGISFAWGRIFYLYGPFEDERRLIPGVILGLLRDGVARCTDGNQIRDYLYVKDVAAAFVMLLFSSVIGAVNIASGEPVRIMEIGKRIEELVQMQGIVWGALPARQDDPKVLIGSIDRLTQEVGWKQRYSLSEGLRETISFYSARVEPK